MLAFTTLLTGNGLSAAFSVKVRNTQQKDRESARQVAVSLQK
ncbi:MAG: hypothetical protein ABSG88_15050 [Bradyrhizobium sp.]|jgi:hypothetical protein